MFLPKFWACPTCGSILGFYFLPWLFPSLEKVGSTLYEMVSQNAEKFHLEDRKHGFLSCTLRVIRAPNPTIFPYEGLVKPPITLLKCAAKFFVFSQLSCSERILEIEVAWFKEKWTKMSLGRLGMVQWFLPLHLQAWNALKICIAFIRYFIGTLLPVRESAQISSRPKNPILVAFWKGNGTPGYFREICGWWNIISFHQPKCCLGTCMTLQLDCFFAQFLPGAVPQVDLHEEASLAGACSSFECGMHLGKPQQKRKWRNRWKVLWSKNDILDLSPRMRSRRKSTKGFWRVWNPQFRLQLVTGPILGEIRIFLVDMRDLNSTLLVVCCLSLRFGCGVSRLWSLLEFWNVLVLLLHLEDAIMANESL